MSRRLALAALLAAGCYVAPRPAPTRPPASECPDFDADGYCADIDCNDRNASIYPRAPDPDGDGVDQNCDGYY